MNHYDDALKLAKAAGVDMPNPEDRNKFLRMYVDSMVLGKINPPIMSTGDTTVRLGQQEPWIISTPQPVFSPGALMVTQENPAAPRRHKQLRKFTIELEQLDNGFLTRIFLGCFREFAGSGQPLDLLGSFATPELQSVLTEVHAAIMKDVLNSGQSGQ